MSGHSAAHDGQEEHSHFKAYAIWGGILTAVTVVELVVLFEPLKSALAMDLGFTSLLNLTLFVLSFFKMGAVIGLFMHLKGDRRVYQILFMSPFVMALAMVTVLTAMVAAHWKAFEHQEAELAHNMSPEDRKDWDEPAFSAAYADLKGDYSKGKAIYDLNCSACHRADGGGLTGPAMTDDCYLHGGDFTSIHGTITNGVNQMPAWGSILKKSEIRDVTYYIRSLRGTKVENPKACEGPKVK